jgi:hypothetical protein
MLGNLLGMCRQYPTRASQSKGLTFPLQYRTCAQSAACAPPWQLLWLPQQPLKTVLRDSRLHSSWLECALLLLLLLLRLTPAAAAAARVTS